MKINTFSILMLFCVVAFTGISGSQAFGQDVNLALKANNSKVAATQSSVNLWNTNEGPKIGGPAEKAIDGDKEGGLWAQKIVETIDNDGWFEVDLGDYFSISKIVIHPRNDNCCTENFKPTLIVSDYSINPPMTDEEKKKMKTSSDVITDNPFGTAMTNDEKIKASSNFYKNFTAAIAKPETVEVNKTGRYVRLQMKGYGGNTRIELAEIEIFGNKTAIAGYKPDSGKAWNDPKNLARNSTVGATTKQSSTFSWGSNSGKSDLAIDGKLDGIAETNPDDKNDWFEIDLKNNYKIDKIAIYPRNDVTPDGNCCDKQFHSTWLIVADQKLAEAPIVDEARIANSSIYAQFFKEPINQKIEIDLKGKIGRYIRLQTKDARIELKEIEVFGEPTPVAGYAPNLGKAWDAPFISPFDPNFPNFRGEIQGGYFGTLHGSPKIVGVKNSENGFDIAFQDNYKDSKKIKVNTYEISGAGFKKNAAKSMELDGLGVFAGFAKDAANRYIFTTEPWGEKDYAEADFKAGKPFTDVKKATVYKNKDVLWEAQYFAAAEEKPEDRIIVKGVRALMNGFHEGTSRLVAGGNSLFITTNIYPSHPYQVVLDTQDKSKNDSRAFFESLNQHNFGQRAIFDGTDFVFMENRDHDVTVSLSKLSPKEVLPLVDPTLTPTQVRELTDAQKNERHPGPFTKRLFSVYSHTNMGNNTYTELGNVEKGFGDNGYLVLFSGERDWNYKMTGYNYANRAPNILSPRDIGLVHVKKDFEKEKANWNDKDGNLSMCPAKVDNSSIVNSAGAKSIINYRANEDGWDWANTYNSKGPCKNTLGSDRSLETNGVKWVTNYGASYAASQKKAAQGEEFTSVNHPKLVRIAQNKYVAVWEEWTAKLGEPDSKYITTKAALITLTAAANGEVNIESAAAPKDLGKIRLMPGDDAFEFNGKAAWAVGDVMKGKLMFYTVDAALNLASFELEL